MAEVVGAIILIAFAIIVLFVIRQFVLLLVGGTLLYALAMFADGRLGETIDSIIADPGSAMFTIGIAFWAWVALKVLTVPLPVEADYPPPSGHRYD